MYNHEPEGYRCPFCLVAKGIENEHDALKETYNCDGVSTRQHNEPCGNQDVWHYHLHVFPRYENDNLYTSERVSTKPEERIEYAARLIEYFSRK